MTDTAAILDAAADLIERPGAWTQNTNARDSNGKRVSPRSSNAVCWCDVGAIMRATNDYYALGGAISAIRAMGIPSLPIWNDTKGRTQAEAVALLRQAAENVRAAK